MRRHRSAGGVVGTAGSPNVIDLDRGLDGGDGSGVGEGQDKVAFVLALVGVRLAIAAIEQAQPVVLDLRDGLSASTFYFPDPLAGVDLRRVEVVVGDQAPCRVPRNADQDREEQHTTAHNDFHGGPPPPQ